jgi:spermidine synthase
MQIHIALFLSGLAALIWEILWLHFANLAIGISAQAAAVILTAMMLGLAAGSFSAELFLKKTSSDKDTRLLALLEWLIGSTGFFIYPVFELVQRLDTWVFSAAPGLTGATQYIAIILALGIPSFLMGATVPVYARIAANFKISMALLYAANTAGAAIGVVLVSFLIIPAFGIAAAVKINIFLNLIAGVFAFYARPFRHKKDKPVVMPAEEIPHGFPFLRSAMIVFCTGFATFVLEVVWFRSLRAALQATTESFALVLSVTLIALAFGGYLAPYLKRSGKVPLACLLALAGFLILQATPIIERFDLFMFHMTGPYSIFMLKRFLFVLIVIGPAMCALGIGLPWLLDANVKQQNAGRLYAVNTLGAVTGALLAAWILLPIMGSTKGAWAAGAAVIIASILSSSKRKDLLFITAAGIAGFFIAVSNESGVGRLRVQGVHYYQYTVLASKEGPDSTVSVIENDQHVRHLFIDGFSASSEGKNSTYMDWMGRLPMLLNEHPKNALVICYGTGQTTNSVRMEGPESLDVVDINPAVFEMAGFFAINQNVLDDQRVRKTVMDGRAFLRRTKKMYDIVTLEPMPPTFAGSNSLYSREFYQLIRQRLEDNGVAAQWLPFHLTNEINSASITATFMEVFSDVILWIDPVSQHGILLGFKRGPGEAVKLQWPGFARGHKERRLSDDEIRQSLIFPEEVLMKFAERGEVITDDNQFLSYGYGRMKWWDNPSPQKHIFNILNDLARKQQTPK